MSTQEEVKLTDFQRVVALPRLERYSEFGTKYLVPIDHPGIMAPGPDFIRVVQDLLGVKAAPGMTREHKFAAGIDYAYRKALYIRRWKLQVGFKGRHDEVEFMPGGLWSLPEAFEHVNSSKDLYPQDWYDYHMVGGPRKRAEVMIIGKHPGNEEFSHAQNFVGPSSSDLHRALKDLGVPREVRRSWYVTNTVKHNRLDPTSGTMQQSWLKNCAPLLQEEIRLVRPKFIACLGTEAIKAVLGKGYTVTNMTGRVVELTFNGPPDEAETHEGYDDLDSYVDRKVMVMGLPHPSYIAHVPEAYPDLVAGLETFLKMVGGTKPIDVEHDMRHSAYYTARPLSSVIDDILERAHHEWDFEADGDLPIAWDAEWHGRHPGEAGAYLRTVQFAVGQKFDEPPKKATAVVLTEKGGGQGWFRSTSEVTRELLRLIGGWHSKGKMPQLKTRHGGHFFKADIPWIRAFLGIDFRPLWETVAPLPKDKEGKDILVPRFDGHAYRKELGRRQRESNEACIKAKMKKKDWPVATMSDEERAEIAVKLHTAHELTRYTGGFDTGYMMHAVFEAVESFDLEQLALRWTSCPRWGTEVELAKAQIAKDLGIKMRDLGGYGDIPDHVILPYSTYDADATLRLFWRLNFLRGMHDADGFLDVDVYQNSSREAAWRTMLAGLTFLEMEETGVTVDVDRGKELIKLFEMAKEKLTTSLREDLKWPAFNPNSAPQTRALLFGEKFSGMVDKKTGTPKKILPSHFEPEGLDQPPIKSTGKPSKAWGQIRDGDKKNYTPAVDKEVLGIYAWKIPVIKTLRDIRYVRQVLQSVLRPPKIGESLGTDADGGAVYDEMDEFDGGFLSYVSPADGRIRSRFYPVETGRCSSAGPNLQNLAKRREDDYKRILGSPGDDGEPEGDYLKILGGTFYNDPIRSIVTAGTWGDEFTVLMEFDIKSAEIAALAWAAGDEQMIDDVNRAMLDPDDPNFLELHSSTAVEAFKLTCAPTKKGLKSIGKPGLRVAAKNVRFGVPYGRSAEALSRQCREEGAEVSVAECQRLIDNYNTRYKRAAAFLDACEQRPYSDKRPYIVGTFGRIRRFQKVDDKSVMADQGRSAKNYPIQNMVADAILLGMYNLRRLREERKLQHAFRVVLQIHDAVMLEVKIPYIGVVKDLVEEALCKQVPIMPRTLDGTPFSELVKDNKELTDDDKDLLHLHLEKPYKFKIDSTVFLNWGQDVDPDRAKALGIPEEYLGGE